MFRFDEYKLRKFDFRMVILIIALCVVGYLVLNSAMVNDADREQTLNKQLLGFCVGGAAMLFFALFDYHLLLKLGPLIYIGNLALLGAVLLFGVELKNATRWLDIGFIQIQPSEFSKIALIIFFASFFMMNRERISKPLVVGGSLLLFAVPAFLILEEPDLSTTLVTTVIFLAMLYVAKISYKWIIGAVAVAVPVAIGFLYIVMQEGQTLLEGYQLNRILSWLYPEQYASTGLTAQQEHSRLAIASGQLYGKGLNNASFESVKNGNFLSEENSDFIFAVVGEELGFIGSVCVIGLLALLVVECFRIGARAKDLGGRLISIGVGSLIAFQTFVNIGVASDLLPNTGLPLPFLSAGVSSLLSIFIGMGIVLNVGLQRLDRSDSDW